MWWYNAPMSKEQNWIRPGIRGLGAADTFRVDPALQRLHWNENPYEFPTELKEIVLERLGRAGWTPYPLGLRPWALIERIAAQRAVRPEQVVVGNGSSYLIQLLMSSVLHPGDAVVMPAPTFLAYRPAARMVQANCIELPLREDDGFALPVDALIEAAEVHDARLVVACAPNNPTGTVYDMADLARLARGCPGLLLIDAAYSEFSGQDFTPLLELGNVLLMHTFSKLYALAGARIGYVLAAPAIAGELQKAVSDFPLSVFAEVAAQVALENPAPFERSRRLILSERERLAAALAPIAGVTVYPSGANFLLVQLARPRQPLLEHLLHEHGVLISNLAAYPELKDCVRISVGAPAQNDLVVRGFQAWAGLSPGPSLGAGPPASP